MQIVSTAQAPTGLVGTIGLIVIDAVTQNILQARTTAGITEYPSNSGIYFWVGTVTDTVHYLVIWDLGSTPDVYAVDPVNQFIPTAIPGAVPVATVGTLTFSIKRNDTAPSLTIQCLNVNADGTTSPVNISGATVYFHMALATQVTVQFLPIDGALQVDREIPVIDGPNGICIWNPQPADTALAGIFAAEVEVHQTDGTIQSFPQQQNIQVTIYPDIGNN